jgi:hypothetical protein
VKAIRDFLELIKFEHTIFALPFAYLGMLLPANGWPGWHLFIWITVAMAAARTAAMGFNRLADRWYDPHNPRTTQHPLVTGAVDMHTAWVCTLLAALILALAAWQLGPLPWRLLPGPLWHLFRAAHAGCLPRANAGFAGGTGAVEQVGLALLDGPGSGGRLADLGARYRATERPFAHRRGVLQRQ